MIMSSAAVRPALSVMLIVSDADAAVRWYTTALGAGRLWDLGGVGGFQWSLQRVVSLVPVTQGPAK
jgi:catechol 2,3-dioxygenase-like lactoylglutathione lyase family enzyme